MKLFSALILVFLIPCSPLLLQSCDRREKAPTEPAQVPTVNQDCSEAGKPVRLRGKTCGTLNPPSVSCYLPDDVEGGLELENMNDNQRAADIFSWQQFIALNWPAKEGERGVPDIAGKITGDGPRVWETWKETYEVYTPSGGKPPEWNAPSILPDGCEGARSEKVLTRSQKIDDLLDSELQAAGATGELPATLTDQKGSVVRYEIKMNRTLYDYIVERGLYNGERQTSVDEVYFPYGSALIKAAWRVIEDGESTDTFYTTKSCVCESGDGSGQPENCSVKNTALVGFHIMRKTRSAPEWVWSTFEQVYNLRGGVGITPSFYDPDCGERECPPNMQTTPGEPNQVVRLIKIPDRDPDCADAEKTVDNIAALNDDLSRSLAEAGSVFRYYELVGTQWPLHDADSTEQAETVFRARPEFLANTTMETFVQDSSTCIGCHSISRTLRPDKFVSGDFSFTLNNARPRPQGAVCFDISASESCYTDIIPPPDKPADEWERENWNRVKSGFDITMKTYELLPGYTGARLHCTSCHLDAGGNPRASWWVNMETVYKTREDLQARINKCFEHSLNGAPLCDPADGGCDDNTAMEDLITYMNWLTRSYRRIDKSGAQPVRGFPAVDVKSGEPERGRAVFEQKCSFCHRNDARGRYQDGIYFRPALVGPDSYSACAGMAKPEVFAAFIKSNMPYGSGGLLTDTESWDIAAYIDSLCRPGKNEDAQGNICSPSKYCAKGKESVKDADSAGTIR